MEFNSWLIDKKIKGLNVSVEMTIGKYWEFAPTILKKNELQRKRVTFKGKTYELLAKDLLEGCIMPPIILAISEKQSQGIKGIIEECVKDNFISQHNETILRDTIEDAITNSQLLILDGLQRSFTIKDCVAIAKKENFLEEFLKNPIRTEIYLGLSKMGILYRMLTLNTGQTPMTLRHQIEILYQDQIDDSNLTALGIELLREVDETSITKPGQYKFSDVADMYYAYTVGEPYSQSKQSITTILRENEFLEQFNIIDAEILTNILVAYNEFVNKIHANANDWNFKERLRVNEELSEEFKNIPYPFGNTTVAIFCKVQVMAGFAAACSKLKRLEIIKDFNHLKQIITTIDLSNLEETLDYLILYLDEIKLKSNRVGDSQRAYFTLLFKRLLNPDDEGAQIFFECITNAKTAYDASF